MKMQNNNFKVVLVLLSLIVLLSIPSCSLIKNSKVTKIPVPTTTTNTSEQQYQQAINKLLNDALALEYSKADYESKKQQLAQQITNYENQIQELNGRIENAQINYNNEIVKYQKLSQDYLNLQTNNGQTITLYNNVTSNITAIKGILNTLNSGTGLVTDNLTATEKTTFYALFQKWYRYEFPTWAK